MTSTLSSTLLSRGKPRKEWNWNKGQRRAKKRDKLSLWWCHSLWFTICLQLIIWYSDVSSDSGVMNWISFIYWILYNWIFFFTFCNTIGKNYSGTISSVLVNGQTLFPPFHTICWVKSSVKSITHCSNFYLESTLIKLDI